MDCDAERRSCQGEQAGDGQRSRLAPVCPPPETQRRSPSLRESAVAELLLWPEMKLRSFDHKCVVNRTHSPGRMRKFTFPGADEASARGSVSGGWRPAPVFTCGPGPAAAAVTSGFIQRIMDGEWRRVGGLLGAGPSNTPTIKHKHETTEIKMVEMRSKESSGEES